jgi:hypothetical protein
MLKINTKIWWPAIISNQKLWTRTEEEPIEIQIRSRKFRWLGHGLRKKEEEIPKQRSNEERRKPGWPKESWIRTTQSS